MKPILMCYFIKNICAFEDKYQESSLLMGIIY